MKFKMAATAGLGLTLDPMGKMFQNASSLNSFPHISVSGCLPRISAEAPLDVSISFPHKQLWTVCLHVRISASRRPSIISG
jgi:hypothetical protein